MKLLLSQRNQLFDTILGHGYPSEDFDFVKLPVQGALHDENSQIIYLPNSEYYFQIGRGDVSRGFIEYSPGESQLIASRKFAGWNDLYNSFTCWLMFLKRELEESDLWGGISTVFNKLGLQPILIDTHFSSDEFIRLEKYMNELQIAVKTLQLNQDQQTNIILRLEESLNRAKSERRIDWASHFIGGMMSLFITLSVTPNVQSKFWSLVKAIFSGILLTSNI